MSNKYPSDMDQNNDNTHQGGGADNASAVASEPRVVKKAASSGQSRAKGATGSGRKSSKSPAKKTQDNQVTDPYMYFTERDLDQILSNLDQLRESVFPRVFTDHQKEEPKQQFFPSLPPLQFH